MSSISPTDGVQSSESTKPRLDGYRKDNLDLDGIDKLTSPGKDSNWLDWAFLMETNIAASIYGYVMLPAPVPPPSHYAQDKAKLCGVLTRYVTSPNLKILRKHPNDPRGMWTALKNAHEGNTAGSRMYWLEKLISFRMESDDVDKELNRVVSVAERLNAMITVKHPLNIDEILVMVVCIMLPNSFKATTTPLLQRDVINLAQIITAVREEVTRASIKPSDTVLIESVSVATEKKKDNKRPICCGWCKRNGHFRADCPRHKRGNENKNQKATEMDELKEELAKLKTMVKKSH